MNQHYTSLLIALLLACTSNLGAQIIRVKPGGTGNGSTWAAAAGNLQQVLAQAVSGQEIWVAAGTYRPTSCTTCTAADRSVTFAIASGVKVYGGFSGSETTRAARRPATQVTILSGDIDADAQITNNSYHIVSFSAAAATTVLDGFTIRDGYANGANELQHGGGIYNDGSGTGRVSSPTIAACIFLGNRATTNGGAIYNNGFFGLASPAISDCTFRDNRAREGGAMQNQGFGGDSSPRVLRCIFDNNQATSGGAVYNSGNSGISSPRYESCLFKLNRSTGYGGAVYNFAKDAAGRSAAVMVNCIFDSNTGDSAAGAIYTLGSNGGRAEPSIVGCVIYNNYSRVGGGVYANASDNGVTNVRISNTIFSANRAGFDVNLHFSGNATPVVTLENVLIDATNCVGVTGSTGGTLICNANTIFSSTPGFVSASTGDFRLASGSVGIDAGLNSAYTAVSMTTDFAGAARVQGVRSDIGAYEFSTGDSDGDGVPDLTDNCPSVANATQTDADADGFGASCDCNDANAAITVGTVFYADTDADTYGNLNVTQTACTAPAGYVARSGDCNDASAAIKPGATELCDGIDNDCDGQIDEGIVDVTAPVIVCRNISRTLAAGSTLTLLPTDVYASGTDNCGLVTPVSVSPNGFTLPGNYTVTLTARDEANNTATCTATVTVTAEPVTPGTYCAAGASEPWTEWVAGVKLGTIDNASGKCGASCGYSSFTNLIANVETGAPYMLTLTPGLSYVGYQPALYWRVYVDWNGDGDFADAGETAAQSDNSFATITRTITVPAVARIGATRMRVTMRRDQAALACGAYIPGEVEDYTLNILAGGPRLSLAGCPSDITINVPTSATGSVATWTAPTAFTTCSTPGTKLTRISGPASGATLPLGVTTIRYAAADSCSNRDTCVFRVSVIAAPAVLTLTCPSNQSITLTTGQRSTTVTWTVPTATTTCSGAATVTRNAGPAPGASFNVGVTTITYSATDGCGSTKSCSFTITVLPAGGTGTPATYCPAGASEPWTEWIAGVKLGNVDNASGKCDTRCGYGDFTAQVAALTSGSTASITLTPGLSWPGYMPMLYWRVYIDWNADGDFVDAGETVTSATPGNQAVTKTFTVPTTASGLTRMRVTMQPDAYAGSCEAFAKGEVEDYGILVAAPAPAPLRQLLSFDESRLAEMSVSYLRAYPNPVRSALSLSWSGDVEELRMVSISGQVVWRLSAKPAGRTALVEVAGFVPGMYVVVAQGADGRTEAQRVVVE